MAKLDLSISNLNLLRKKAEKKTKAQKESNSYNGSTNHDKELDLYKVELEIQNEELLDTQYKLIKSINEYTLLFENAPVGYIILDENGVITKLNTTANKLLGLEATNTRKKYFSTFIKHKSSQDRFYIYKNLTLDTKFKQQFECKIKISHEKEFDAYIESTSIYNKTSKSKQILCTIVDISKQKEQEKILKNALKREKELTELKSDFISIASHEFRTPLSTILTSTELIEKYNLLQDDEKKQRHFQKITASVARIKDILTDFLTSEQIEKGEKDNNPQLLNIIDFMNSTIDEINILYDTNNVKYLHKSKNNNVSIDEHLLKTSITNLIVNAIKYSEKELPIIITSTITNTNKFSIKIKDAGIGIPAINQPNIFNKFYRGNNTGNVGGTGLGLHITKKLVNLMGGNLTFTSKINKGTIFKISFP
jgi:PAS domain S-box-containing protein